MTPTNFSKLAVTGFSLALILTGCGSSGGGTGTGGSSATGGSIGTGGFTDTGGTTGTGGTSTGGITGTGGTSTGGVTGTGGTGMGGTGTGGTAGTGGPGGAGGKAGGGGGGAAGAAGHPTGGGGGKAGAGGVVGTGGSAGTSGGTMTLTSPDQAEGAAFGTMYTCAANNGTFGAGVNPELDWAGVPAGTMSFAITFIDTKIGANMAMGQHWAMWDIPASVMQFPKGTTTLTGALAGAMQTNKYLAPCPSGNDTYEYTLYALSSATLAVTGASGTATSNSAGVAKVLAALATVTPLATATLHGTSGPGGKS